MNTEFEKDIVGNPYLEIIIEAWQYLTPWQQFKLCARAMWYSFLGDLSKRMKF